MTHIFLQIIMIRTFNDLFIKLCFKISQTLFDKETVETSNLRKVKSQIMNRIVLWICIKKILTNKYAVER